MKDKLVFSGHADRELFPFRVSKEHNRLSKESIIETYIEFLKSQAASLIEKNSGHERYKSIKRIFTYDLNYSLSLNPFGGNYKKISPYQRAYLDLVVEIFIDKYLADPGYDYLREFQLDSSRLCREHLVGKCGNLRFLR